MINTIWNRGLVGKVLPLSGAVSAAFVLTAATFGIANIGCGRTTRATAQATVSAASSPGRASIRVRIAPSVGERLNGRLLIFMKPLPAGSHLDSQVDASEFEAANTWVVAQEVRDLASGQSVDVDVDKTAFPKPFSEMPAGQYEAQAVVVVGHSYNYGGRLPEDWIGSVAPLAWTPGIGVLPELTIDRHPREFPLRAAAIVASKLIARLDGLCEEEFVSPSLSRFWDRPVTIKAWVVLPPGYSRFSARKYPTVYWTQPFGGSLDYALSNGLRIYQRMRARQIPRMIWVMMDQSTRGGTHEFANSVNNGPWGTALTSEFIPYLESKYRMDARPSGRLLNGHSSGGWATLQLEVNYPKFFGGTWSTSPDSSDFEDFSGVDIYAPNANVYRRADGSLLPIARSKGKILLTTEELGRLEYVLDPEGGQLSSFNWVFSPKGADGFPEPLFDRATGKVDPQVAAYWGDHYDLARLVESTWPERGADLKGKIHVTVGTVDTFYLDGSAHKFEAVLNRLGADPHFTYLPGRSHLNVYVVGDDPRGLLDRLGAEMYAVARPGSRRK